MKAILTLCHGDEVSGTTIFDDGTKVYWTEGRSSEIVIVYPDGTTAKFPVSSSPHPIMEALEDHGPVSRMMTAAEELEFDTANA